MENILDKINNINNDKLFKYIIIIIIIIFILKKLELNAESLIILIISFIIFKFLIDNRFKNNLDDIGNSEKLLNNLQGNTNFLHYDKNLIYFLDFIKEYKIYNEQDYKELINNINNFLRIESDLDIGTQYCKYDVDSAIIYKKNTINIFHSFIHSLPSNKVINNKHNWAQEQLNTILTNHLNKIINKCSEISSKKDIHTHSFFPELISNIEGFDPNINLNYNYIL
jgi:hypothetical protein